ncbi:MAG: class E sortase [Actinobacteria bacterium]|nr:MAG: class E sortase [Actinomycetota bacterium]
MALDRRSALRALSSVLVVAGIVLLADAAATLAWQEPLSALYTRLRQDSLAGDLRALEREAPSPLQLGALSHLDAQQRIAFLARALRARARPGSAVGRIRIPHLGTDFVLVAGTDTDALRDGPGIYSDTPFPGAPGTVGVAGHRTTYLAPFRHIDSLRRGDRIELEMPYARLIYTVQDRRIVAPTDVAVVDPVGYDRLVLSACHPLYSAAQRIVVFAALVREVPRGAATQGPGPEAVPLAPVPLGPPGGVPTVTPEPQRASS